MKTFKIFSLALTLLAFSSLSIAQTTEESFRVSGNCGMCKSKIEKAATAAGASYAVWDQETKILTVKFNSESTNAAKIQKKIAKVGYDNAGFKAKDEAYNKLHGCCKYDRDAVKSESACCVASCEMKDGKCVDMAACESKGCCKDSEKCKANGCCDAKKNGATAKHENCSASCCAKN